MSFTDITMAILSHHPVQLLATTVLLVHLARAVFWGPTGERKSQPARLARARGFDRRAHRLFTEIDATGHAERLAKGDRPIAAAN
jgi:hypothetical protein